MYLSTYSKNPNFEKNIANNANQESKSDGKQKLYNLYTFLKLIFNIFIL